MSTETYYGTPSEQIRNLAEAINLLLKANKDYLNPAIGIEADALVATIARIREAAWPSGALAARGQG